MSILYYNSIFNNKNKAYALMKAAEENFGMFEEYLDLAIEAQKKRRVSAKWKPADDGVKVKITHTVKCMEIEIKQSLEFAWEDSWYEVFGIDVHTCNINEDLIFKKRKDFITLEKEQIIVAEDSRIFINLEFTPDNDETIIWGESKIHLEKFDLHETELIIYQPGANPGLQLDSVFNNKVNNSLTVSFSGVIDPNLPLIVNGFTIERWRLVNTNDKAVFYVDDNPLSIIKREGSLIYTRTLVNKDSILRCEGINVPFRLKETPLPQKVLFHGNILDVQVDDKQVKLYGETKALKSGDKVIDCYNASMECAVTIEKGENDPYSIWIELLDEDDDYEDDGSIAVNSKLDYFFAEDITELEEEPVIPLSKRKRFRIERSRREERQIKLRRFDNRVISEDDLPNELYVPVNTYQLERQKEANSSIKERPLIEHKYLLALTEKKTDNHPWLSFAPYEPEEWYVLTDGERDGTENQRNFVRKAIATEDFVLLEGPPGSGKTTAILELIIQLAKLGKRILLSASTHVAIDNVLERLQKSYYMDFIVPLRIGKEDVISDSIKAYSIGNIANENLEYSKMIIDSANLVCGTTIGILQHPNFKSHKKDEPVVPEFDYLIIDESSKTTFQEFLVPALHAKKWILVGDVKQLSPYTEVDHLVASLEEYSDKNEMASLGESAQRACLLIWKYISSLQLNSRYCIVERDVVIESMKKELQSRYNMQNKGINTEKLEKVAFLEKRTEINNLYKGILNIVTSDDCRKGNPISWILPSMNVLFIKQSELQEFKKYIPSNMYVLFRNDWELEPQQFRMESYYHKNRDGERQDKRFNKTSSEIIKENNAFLKDKSWAQEVVWRTIRLHDLRESKKSTEWLLRDIDYLIPELNKEIVNQKYEVVRDIAIPSILESLKVGVGKRKENDKLTVLNSGFEVSDLSLRYECLDFQHRMHPEISAFPREQFYIKDGALKDASSINREWNYRRYSSRSIWIDVNGETYRGTNIKEVSALVREVEEFVKWAKTNPKEDEEPWVVACLTFYKGQERKIREELRKFPNCSKRNSQFEKNGITVLLYTIDKFQGREADITFISMVQTNKDGFLDSPNRLNVAITRAKYQRVIVGKKSYFLRSKSEDLKNLAYSTASLYEEVRK